MKIEGTTRSLLSRLPDFYQASDSDSLLFHLLAVFGQTLEDVEADMFRIMRAHWVDTAGNAGSRGFDTAQKGDLDKIFAFYLEHLGGTSQLKQINYQFVDQDLIDLNELIQQLHDEQNPLSQYLREQFAPATLELLATHRYAEGQIILRRTTAGTELHIPRGTRFTLTRDDGSIGVRKRFSSSAAAVFDASLAILSVPVRALSQGLAYEVTTTGAGWQIEASDGQLAELTASNSLPLRLPTAALRQTLISELNRIIQHPLYTPARFAKVTLSADLKAQIENNPQQGRALALLNYALLEAAYPRALARSYTGYRQRLRGVIAQLLGGASTVEGITNIVAVNLGIIGDSEQAQAARAQIRVREFRPIPLTVTVAGPGGRGLLLWEEFSIDNPNLIAVAPTITVRLHPNLSTPLAWLRLVNRSTGRWVQFNQQLRRNDEVIFARDGSASWNGLPTPGSLSGRLPELPPGRSIWRCEAAAGVVIGRFEQSFFDSTAFEQDRIDDAIFADLNPDDSALQHSRFDLATAHFDRTTFLTSDPRQRSRFDQDDTHFDQAPFLENDAAIAAIRMSFDRQTPGTFTVLVPWDIEGYTDKFAEFDDHPRHQIKYIVEKVKAAGIFAAIAYTKTFREQHRLSEMLTLRAHYPLPEAQTMQERFEPALRHSPSADSAEMRHSMADALATSGVFDCSYFDSALYWRKPGVFDEARFDKVEFWIEAGTFDSVRFDQVEFDADSGHFDQDRFDQITFDPESGQFEQVTFDTAMFWSDPAYFDVNRFSRASFDEETP